MPHLKNLLHFTRQKRDNISAVKMSHHMFIRVVLVALRLVLREEDWGLFYASLVSTFTVKQTPPILSQLLATNDQI